MAIKNELGINELVQIFIDDSKFLKDYESAEKIINNEKHNYNTARKVSTEKTNIIKKLLSTENGVNALTELLKNDDLVIVSSAAEVLYPLYPKMCIEILKNYSKSLSNKLDRYKVDCMIEGYIKKQEFFINNLKKLYNTENLESLNRE